VYCTAPSEQIKPREKCSSLWSCLLCLKWIQKVKEETAFTIGSGNLIQSTKAGWLLLQLADCIYNRQWELNLEYKGWLTAFKADRKKAFCKCGDRMIDISNVGESALKLHMRSKRHKNDGTIGGEQAVTLSSFGFVLCGNGNSGEAGKAGTSQS